MKIANCVSEFENRYLFKCDSSISDEEFIQKIKTYATSEISVIDGVKVTYICVLDIIDLDNIPDVSAVTPDLKIESYL